MIYSPLHSRRRTPVIQRIEPVVSGPVPFLLILFGWILFLDYSAAGAIAVQTVNVPAAPRIASPYRADRILVRPRTPQHLNTLQAMHSAVGTRVLRKFPGIANLEVIELPPGANADAMIALYKQSGMVRYAERDFTFHVLATPNDFRYLDGSLWGLHNFCLYGGLPGADISAPSGWDIQNTANSIVVAVIDTGVRYTHEDLAGNMWINPGETGLDALGNDKSTNGIDDDGDGFIDDVHGINAINGSGDPMDDHGHGTHVSGIIGATGNNTVGVVGVCWQARMMACKFIDPNGDGSTSDAVACIDYARQHGAKIINASWGSIAFTSSAMQDAINSARDAGIIFVGAAGNSGMDNDAQPLFPASYNYDNVISVAATTRDDTRPVWSNFGASTVHLTAPGSPIFSCWNGSDFDYRYYDGTSMAAPHVAGACALVWAHYPNLKTHHVIKRVLTGVDPLPCLTGLCVTGGRLNLAGALQPRPAEQAEPATAWVEDDVPAGGVTNPDGGDSWTSEPWNWVTNNPVPFSGAAAHQSDLVAGLHEHHFEYATGTLEVFTGDTLFTYIHLDPANPPREIMLEWNDGCSEHRAFWGENLIPWGTYGTSSCLDMGGLPPAGEWVRLEVPASLLGLEGATLKGMRFMLMDGRATWDLSGRAAAGSPEQ
jgi:subtilisin family serine protease